MSDEQTLRESLESAAENASHQLTGAAARRALRLRVGRALLFVLIGPAALVVWQLIRWNAGFDSGLGFSAWLLALSVILPLGFLGFVRLSSRSAFSRRTALASIDRELRSGDRLITADEFLAIEHRSGFQQAAVEDAVLLVDKARDVHLQLAAPPVRVNLLEKLATPASLVLLALAVWLSTLAVLATAPADPDQIATNANLEPSDLDVADHDVAPMTEQQVPSQEKEADTSMQHRRVGTRASAPASKEIPEGAEEATGSLGSGQTSESEQSSSPSSARGAPSSQGQPSTPGEPPAKKPPKPKQRNADNKQEDRPQSESNEPAGSTAGQGSSRGSNKNPAVSDWSSRDQISTPDDSQVEENDDVEDEEEEQDSRGGVQPNLRDRRPPVNRDLRIGFGNQKNPDANGRGGPGAQKKSRGVASLVLGVPISDRVKGQPNPGKTKVTQQRIEPEFEPSEPAVAQARNPRNGQVGPIYRPTMSPWLQAIVRQYFLHQSETSPSEEP